MKPLPPHQTVLQAGIERVRHWISMERMMLGIFAFIAVAMLIRGWLDKMF